MRKLLTLILFLALVYPANAVIFIQSAAYSESILFSDYFTTDTTGNYTETDTWGTAGTFVYDGTGDRVEITSADSTGYLITHDVTEKTTGKLSVKLRPHTINSSWGWGLVKVILRDKGTTNWYEVCYIDNTHADNTSCDGLYKYIAGTEVDNDPSAIYHTQDTDYTVVIEFSPTETTVTGFGETLTINTNTVSISVDEIGVEAAQQEIYFDDIEYGL